MRDPVINTTCQVGLHCEITNNYEVTFLCKIFFIIHTQTIIRLTGTCSRAL